MGKLQSRVTPGHARTPKTSKMAAGVSTSSGRPSPTRRPREQQHAVEVPGHPQIVEGQQQSGAAVGQPPRESQHLERMAHVELGNGSSQSCILAPVASARRASPDGVATAEPRTGRAASSRRSKAASASSTRSRSFPTCSALGNHVRTLKKSESGPPAAPRPVGAPGRERRSAAAAVPPIRSLRWPDSRQPPGAGSTCPCRSDRPPPSGSPAAARRRPRSAARHRQLAHLEHGHASRPQHPEEEGPPDESGHHAEVQATGQDARGHVAGQPSRRLPPSSRRAGSRR